MTTAARLKKQEIVQNDMVRIPGGTFFMGSDGHYPEEAPAHAATVSAFLMDIAPVTNREFALFVAETGYVTAAEKPAKMEDYPGADPAMLVPSSVVFKAPPGPLSRSNHYNWWSYIAGANWRHPWGPESNIIGLDDHPVVHVDYEDAEAYASWIGKSLPSEAEWEFAARGGLAKKEYAWGDEFMPDGKPMAHTWQGDFPWQNNNKIGTMPVKSFPANGYGLFDMIGNVWEWTEDWYQGHAQKKDSCCANDSRRETSIDTNTPDIRIPRRVMKGGSFLCAPAYCRRYRPAARMAQPIDTSTCHLGFRCIIRES